MLKPPRSWRDELAEALAPEAFAVPDCGALELPLTPISILPQRLGERGIVLAEVAADLGAGFTSELCHGSGGEVYYRLSGSRFDVFVKPKPERDSGAPIAIVTQIKLAQRLARQKGYAMASVSFHMPWEVAHCEIAHVHRLVEDLRQRASARRDAAKRAGRALAGVGLPADGRGALHADVRRRYSALRLMLTLLRRRREVEDGARAVGEVMDSPNMAAAAGAGLLCVRMTSREGEFEDRALVTVSTPDRKRRWRLEAVRVDDEHVFLEPPTSADLAPGLAVELSYEPRFALERHDYALRRFLDEGIEGEWSALARLLSAPATLSGQRRARALSMQDGTLNAEQRRAVEGAVAAPHAFFIQGPPGTGKTTVIAEIVRQLVARGERVLLLAPMHVAVDEVLRRVGDTEGVLALRISWDDSKVREELRRFLPANVADEFVRHARRPATSKATEWRREIDRLMAEHDVIARCIAERASLEDARALHAESVRARDSWRREHRAARRALDAELAERREALSVAQAALEPARQSERDAAAALAAAHADRKLLDRIVGAFALGAVARLKRDHSQAEADAIAAERECTSLTEWVGESVTNRDAFDRDGTARARAHDRHCASAASLASARLADAAASESQLRRLVAGATLDDATLARHAEQRQARAARIRKYINLEQRWFEITGLSEIGGSERQRGLIEDLGGSLLQAANLVCCTTTGFGGDPLVRDSDYDTLIVDEASRVIDSEFLIGANRARRWILVGDEYQLPPYVNPVDEHHLHALAALHMAHRASHVSLTAAVAHLGRLWREDEELHRFRQESVERVARRLLTSGRWHDTFEASFSEAHGRLRRLGDDAERELLAAMRLHLVRSLFERCVEACPASLRQRLVVQRRMIEPIARLVRDPIYAGDYRSPSEQELRRCGVTPLVGATLAAPVVFLDTSNQRDALDRQSGTGFVNPLEVTWIVRVCRLLEAELSSRGEEQVTISVLTFYGAQARALRKELGHPGYRTFRTLSFEVVDSIDRIQGQESQLVVLSFCRTHRARPGPEFGLWLQDRRRLNVACTRARRGLVLVGHRRTLERLTGIDEAVAFYRNLFEVIDSGVNTVVSTDLR